LKSGSLNLLEPSGPVQACNGIDLPFHSLMTTNHPSNINLPSSGQQVTAWLTALKVSVARGSRAQDPLVRDTTLHLLQCHPYGCLYDIYFFYAFKSVMSVALYNVCLYHRICNFASFYNISTFGFFL
jgi:hypothetical protein